MGHPVATAKHIVPLGQAMEKHVWAGLKRRRMHAWESTHQQIIAAQGRGRASFTSLGQKDSLVTAMCQRHMEYKEFQEQPVIEPRRKL